MKRFYFSYRGRYEWKTADQVVAAASEDIKNEDFLNRRFAIAALYQLSNLPAAQAATTLVAQALADEDAGVRYWAANALIGLGNVEPSGIVEHHELVAATLKDIDPGVRCYAAIAMTQIAAESDNAIPYTDDFVAALKDSDPQVRIEATKALVLIQDAEELGETATSHVEALRDRRQPLFRASGAEALGLLGSAGLPYVPDLINALQDKYASVRAAAAKALGCLGIEALRETSPLLVGLANTDADADVRTAAAQALDMVDMREALQHKDAKFRAWAAERAVGQGVKALEQHLDRLGEMLKDDNAKVRCWAATALGHLGDIAKAYIQGLLANALEDTDAEARVAATKALVKVDGRALRDSAQTMSAFLKHEDVASRRAAADCLGAIGSDAKGESSLLNEALSDKDTSVRLAICRALFNIGKPAVRTCGNTLGQIAREDEDRDVRKSAAFALYEFNLAVKFGLPPK